MEWIPDIHRPRKIICGMDLWNELGFLDSVNFSTLAIKLHSPCPAKSNGHLACYINIITHKSNPTIPVTMAIYTD